MNTVFLNTTKGYLMVASRKIDQPGDRARGIAGASENSRWQLAVQWFESIAKKNTSWQVTSSKTAIRCAHSDVPTARPFEKRYVYQRRM